MTPTDPHHAFSSTNPTLQAEKGTIRPAKDGQAGQEVPPADLCLDKVSRSYRRKRLGAAVVEFAVVAPVFFLLVFGMLEFGRMVMVQQVLTNASREGARAAVLDGATASSVTNQVTSYLANSSISGSNLTVTVDPSPPNSAAAGEAVTVTISIPFRQVSWLPTPMFIGSKQMTAATSMRRESVQ